ncbi:helix-turn-helix domain-containing protein [Sphingobium lactosutens]|uniref:helix-turn-helix domain-containing protein n=1 Tax=Sphingobium lactosutens TaxID=522773 RepID=UPI0015BC41F6|nr:helix-turn-helix transcriptional regulator [Sphingobium lactosutens]
METNFGDLTARLREARQNLGLKQSEMAALGEVSLNTQNRYEGGTMPSVEYLLRIGEAGADWYWIVTGQRIGDALSQQESAFLDAFRKLDDVGREALLLVATRMVNNTHSTDDGSGAD